MTHSSQNHGHDELCSDSLPLHARFLRTGRGRQADERAVLAALHSADIQEAQIVPWGSNYTFAVSLERDGEQPFLAIYKPERGEAPLWDFPPGTLFKREYASYVLSRFLGWRFVPPTVIRTGPHGLGTVQLYIEPEQERRRVPEWYDFRDELQQMALFDVIANNADRKASHFFLGKFQRQIWGIDHGLTFNLDPKLRTVLWEFEGEVIAPHHRRRLSRVERHQEQLFQLLEPYLNTDEIIMLFARTEQLLREGKMPRLTSRRSIPYGW